MKVNPGTLIVPFKKLSSDCGVDLCIAIIDVDATVYPLIIGITWNKECVIKTVPDFYLNKGKIIQRAWLLPA